MAEEFDTGFWTEGDHPPLVGEFLIADPPPGWAYIWRRDYRPGMEPLHRWWLWCVPLARFLAADGARIDR